MPIYSFNFVLTIVFAIVMYRAGTAEDSPGILWAALSASISLVIWLGLGWGLVAMTLGQVALFIGIGVFRMMRDPN